MLEAEIFLYQKKIKDTDLKILKLDIIYPKSELCWSSVEMTIIKQKSTGTLKYYSTMSFHRGFPLPQN